jgi:hypothetical protein
MFKAMGWVVESTAASGDHGIDGIIRRDGHTAIVQCKRYAVGRTVGEPEIRDLTGAVTKSSAERGILVTTASFTKRAEAWASTEKIELIDGDKLAGMLQCAFPDELPFPASIPIEGFGFDSLPKVCPVDGGRIGAIQGIRGVFLACKNHPRCHWTQNLSLDEAAELPYRPRPSRRVRELLKAGGRLRRSNG